MSKFTLPTRFRALLAMCAVTTGLSCPTGAWADDSRELLKAMSDYLAAQKTFSFDYVSSVEAVTPAFEKLQFVSSGTAAVSRPDKIRVTRTGGFADLDVSFDGAKLTVHGKNLDAYAQIDAKGSLDELFDRLENAGAEIPGSDLLLSNSFETLMDGVTEAKHIASAVIDGVEVNYLTFRKNDVDWQIWIEAGPKPIPKRYIVTSKHVVQAPQYMLEVRNFRTGEDVKVANFAIEIPGDAKKVDLSELGEIDELPAPTGMMGDAQ
ncbi:DUF2092 domain-containing protein [Rhizobium cauense]|uniref:DUF2092 domain-containing protein n=1 Tax=Rhizobium cauense TaxID=1166683 RepID=UPI001C6EB09A|nr:DUF2092 domain-containing protein [Rhizobium cauense]MBW9115432.1 DUF2092 domain-containing protein [Rhizobium cauense]